jgi:Glucosyl transferase GtrII
MSVDLHSPDETAFAGPLDLYASPSLLVIWGLAFFLVYGYELFNFSLSIDEELYTFGLSGPLGWLQQGRWGMALFSWVLPRISALPVVSTALFGAGLLFTVAHLAAHYRLQGLSALLFGVVLIASPIWPHIVEFNSLSYGIGIGLALCAIGVRLLRDRRRLVIGFGFAALVFSGGIYQTLLLAAMVMVLGRDFLGGPVKTGNGFGRVARDLALIVGAGILTFCLQYIARRFANATVTYIDIYWRVSDYLVSVAKRGKNPTVSIWGESLRHDCINAELKVRRKDSYDVNWSTSPENIMASRSCEGPRAALATPLVGSVFAFDLRGGQGS